MSGKDGFAIQFVSPFDESAVVIEDDGRVAYAYIFGRDGAICGDVWLYNRYPAPAEPEWHDPANMPFANSASFVNESSGFLLPDSARDFSVTWAEAGGALVARVFLRGGYFARLEAGAKPGWSALAARDGPLAQVLR
jgi:hypothetical protein